MGKKPIPQRYFWIILFPFLAACEQQAVALSVETPVPSVISPTSAPTSTFIPVTITPSPLPTQPIIPMITPDAIQVKRWKEYQTELAKSLLSFLPPEEVICEWDILGSSGNDLYVWAMCEGKDGSARSTPAVIHLETDGTIQSVQRPTSWSDDIPKLFPVDIQAKFDIYYFGRSRELSQHTAWRRTHPDEPPLIVLSTTPMP
ncbi:MAG TPA: hypothetical protein VFR47_31470 [Anaerolineales bacterium]|nr:hypothetical protein [Anaerolineales bacterium]